MPLTFTAGYKEKKEKRHEIRGKEELAKMDLEIVRREMLDRGSENPVLPIMVTRKREEAPRSQLWWLGFGR